MAEAARSDRLLLALATLLAAFALWAALMPLEVVASAGGRVVPASRVQLVQHLEGGIVRQILVSEGARVAEGEPLMALDGTRLGAELAGLEARLAALAADEARFAAEAAGAPMLALPPELAGSAAGAAAVALFEARRRRHALELEALAEARTQRAQEIEEVQLAARHAERALALVRDQVGISEQLLRRDITSRMTHLGLEREAAGLSARLEELRARAPRARAALAEAEAAHASAAAAFLEEARAGLAEARRQRAELGERLGALKDAEARLTLRAPVAGTVKTLVVRTPGAVVQPGQVLLEIVPGDDRLEVEAQLPVADIGHVRPGQPVQLRLAGPEGGRFGILPGRVEGVAPDSVVAEGGRAYYRVRIAPEAPAFTAGALSFALVPGLEVSCAIITGRRTVASTLLDPFLAGAATALRER